MDIDVQNPWWYNELDEKFEAWQGRPVKWRPKLVNSIDITTPGLNFLTGPRQVGKTTTLKILINDAIENHQDPYSIFYCPCDEIVDFRELGEVLDSYLSIKTSRNIDHSLIIIDEITLAQDWWRAIKARIDDGKLIRDMVILSGSASIELLKEKERFPGRRGQGLDFTLYPLSFQEYAAIWIDGLLVQDFDTTISVEDIFAPNRLFSGRLAKLFETYMITGGFPSPIQDQFSYGKITHETKRTFIDWVRGDVQKAGKDEGYMKEVISYLLKTRCSPVSWLSITKNTGFTSPHTAQAYVEVLQQLYVVEILNQITPDGRIDYRKNKKIHFSDPFLATVLADYTDVQLLDETLVEGIVATHLARKYPVYYWKNATEVDAIAEIQGEQVGFELKWGPKHHKKPAHLKKYFQLVKDTIPAFLASVDWTGAISMEQE
jgi:hypothetical protein